MNGTDAGKPRVQSAARTMLVLLAVARSEDGLKARDIAEALGLPRQVVYHIAHTLLAIGMIRKNHAGRYVLGLGVAPIAQGFTRHLAAPEHLAPAVRQIAAETGETAYATGWVEGRIVVLATARGGAAVQAAEVPHGFSDNPHARASGKLLLALASEERQAAFFRDAALAPRTPNTLTTEGELRREFARIRRLGYATDIEEFVAGLCCLAVPIEALDGSYALGISVPTARFKAQFQRDLGILQRVARQILPAASAA